MLLIARCNEVRACRCLNTPCDLAYKQSIEGSCHSWPALIKLLSRIRVDSHTQSPPCYKRLWLIRFSRLHVLLSPHFHVHHDNLFFFSPSGPFQPSDDMMLMFYSYYKQATVGPCNIPRPSGFWDSRGRIKWYMIFPTRAPG